MTSLDSSTTVNQNLPFYLNDYDEQQGNFICFRLKGTLNYSNIISGNNNYFYYYHIIFVIIIVIMVKFLLRKKADFSQTERQLNDQFENISNDLQKLSFYVKSSNLILSNLPQIKSLNPQVNDISQIYENYFKKQYEQTTTDLASSAILKKNLIVNITKIMKTIIIIIIIIIMR